MAIESAFGSGSSPTGTPPVAQNVAHGLSGTPDLFIMWGTNKTLNGTPGQFNRWAFGACDASLNQGCVITVVAQAQSSHQTRQYSDKVYGHGQPAASLTECSVTAMDATNVTLSWSTVFSSGLIYYWAAFKGLDAKVLNAALAGSAGPQAIAHGMSSAPKALICANGRPDTTVSGFVDDLRYSLGAGDAAGNQWCSSAYMDAGFGNFAKTGFSSTKLHQQIDGSGAAESEAELTSIDATNINLNVTVAKAQTILLVLLGGDIEARVGVDSQKTSTGTKATTGVGFPPELVMLASSRNAADGFADHAQQSMGFASSAAARMACAVVGELAASTTTGSTGGVADDIAVLYNLLPDATPGNAPSILSRADYDGADADGFTLDWEVADATARLFGYLALADAGGGGTTVTKTSSLDAALLKAGITRTASVDAALQKALTRTASLDAALMKAAIAVTAGVDAYLASSFSPLGIKFAGSNDYLTRGADLTGSTDGRSGSLVLWFDSGLDGTTFRLFGQIYCFLAKDSEGRLQISVANADVSNVFSFRSAVPQSTEDGFICYMASWDTDASAGNKVGQIYRGNTAVGSVVADSGAAFDINYTESNWAVGATPAGGQDVVGCLAELWFAQNTFIDFSVEENRRKFLREDGTPEDLGEDGTAPGVTPIVYLSYRDGEDVGDFATNRGAGGDFSITGTLEECETPLVMDTSSGVVVASLDAALKKLGITVAASLDAALKRAGLTLTASLDAAVFKRQAITAALDAALLKNVSLTAGVDAVLTGDGSLAVQAAVDAALMRMGIAVTASLDAVLAKRYTATASLDAALLKGLAKTASVDAALSTPAQIAAAVDAALMRQEVLSAVLDAFIVTPGLDRDAAPLRHGGRGIKVDQPGRSFATPGRRRGFTTIH